MNQITGANRIAPAEPANVKGPVGHETTNELQRAIRERWPVILGIAALTTLLGWGIGMMQPKRYRSSAVAAIVPASESLPEPADRLRGLQGLDQRTIIASVAALTSMPVIADPARGGATDDYDLRAIVLPNTNLLRIDVDGPDAARAAAIANRVPTLLDVRTRAVFGLYSVTAVSPAGPGELIFPRIERIVAAALVIGLILGLTTAWMLTALRRGVPALQ